jgi:putative Holliday junction resolvase
MRAAGVDLGTVRVGLAVADELGLLAHPRPHLGGKDLGRLVRELVQLAVAEGIEVFVVGLPRRLDGSEGPEARRARRFADSLRQKSGRRVVLWDEWLTTKEAAGRLRERGLSEKEARSLVDSEAAAVLLQSYLDAKRTEEP